MSLERLGYSCNNLKPITLCTLLDNAVVVPKTPPKPAAKPKTPSAPKKKKTAPKKRLATKFPSNKQLINAATSYKPHKCKDAKNKGQIREWILVNSTKEQLDLREIWGM